MAVTDQERREIRLDTINELAEDLESLMAAYEGDIPSMVTIYENHPLWNMPSEILGVFATWLHMEHDQRIAEWAERDKNGSK